MNRSKIVRVPALLIACALLLNSRPAGAQELAVQFHDGLVTLIAREMTVSRILDRWARTAGVMVINGETIDGPPLSLQLVDVPEREALAILLRNVGGYILAARHEGLQGSVFDRIVVVQSSGGSFRNQPAQLVGQFANPPALPDNSDAEQSVFVPHGVAGQSAERAVFAALPNQPGPSAPSFAPQGNGSARTPAATAPGASIGTSRPGEISATPSPTRLSAGPQKPPQQ